MSDRNSEREQEMAHRARELFADSVAGLDGQTRSRLARIRADAVEASARGRSWITPSQLLPIGGVAAAVLAVAVFWGNPQAPVDPVASAALTDLDILLEGEELDLLEELEFYAWLLAQPELLEPAIEQDDNG
jgi:hypothetical protein